MMKKIELNYKNNKVDLLYLKDDSLPIVVFKLVFKASGVCSENIQGLAKLCAKMLNEGNLKLGSEFNKKLENKAIELYASCGYETFVIEINCLKEHFDFAFGYLKELLKEPNFTEEILQKCKMQTIGEIASLKTDFDYIAKLGLNSLLYNGTSLGYASIGTKDSIESITLKDIKDFFSFLDLNNLFLVLGGDINDDFIDYDSLFCVLNCKEKREILFISTSHKEEIKDIIEDSEQAYIYFGAPYYVENNERFKANVAAFILGAGGFGSRLMEEIRVKRGLAYSAYAKNDLGLSRSKIWGYLQTKNENMKDAIDVVKEEFQKFCKSGVSKNELESAKKFLLGSVVLQKESMIKRLNIHQNEYYSGFEFNEFDRNLERISNLSLDEINSFIFSHNEITKLSFSLLHK